MKRVLPIALAASCLAFPLFCIASGMMTTYDAVEYNQEVVINGWIFSHDSPLMEINDRLYVSLEDFADYRGYVYHPENEGTIEISTEYSDGRVAFEKLMGITLMTKQLGKKKFDELLSGLVIKPAGKPVLVQDTDPRPEFNTAQIDFNGDM